VYKKQRPFTWRLSFLLLPHLQHATTLPGDKRILTENNCIKLLFATENHLSRAPMIFRCYPQAHFLLPKHLPILLGLIATSRVTDMQQKHATEKISPQ